MMKTGKTGSFGNSTQKTDFGEVIWAKGEFDRQGEKMEQIGDALGTKPKKPKEDDPLKP